MFNETGSSVIKLDKTGKKINIHVFITKNDIPCFLMFCYLNLKYLKVFYGLMIKIVKITLSGEGY